MKRLCAIFDLDGTLVDSEVLNCRAYVELIAEIDESDTELTKRYRGMKFSNIVSDIETSFEVALPDDFESLYRDRVAALYESELKANPGVPELLSGLEIERCVASSAPIKKINHALELTGLGGYFGTNIFSSYDIGSWKPEPDLFLHAAATMNHRPAHCAVVEDSDLGVEAAIAAGMHVFHYAPNSAKTRGDRYQSIQQMSELSGLFAEFAKAI
jgi:HAD superfamily hydrolase (TIGR01509 family)